MTCRSHTTRKRTLSKAAGLLLSLSVLIPACGGIEVTSTYRDRTIVIDGDGSEWAGMPLRTQKNISFAVCNDSTYLYILLSTSDRGVQRQIMAAGLNLWFDATGGSDKTFGIHFPVGMQGGQRPSFRDGDQEQNPGEPAQPPRMAEGAIREMELLGPGKDDKMIVPLVEEKDILLKVSPGQGQLVYELRVPLVRDRLHPRGIGASLAGPVGVGVETPKFDFDAMRANRGSEGMEPGSGRGGEMPPGEGGGGRAGGGYGGRGGRGGRGGGRGGERPGGSAPEALSLWATVKLAGK